MPVNYTTNGDGNVDGDDDDGDDDDGGREIASKQSGLCACVKCLANGRK